MDLCDRLARIQGFDTHPVRLELAVPDHIKQVFQLLHADEILPGHKPRENEAAAIHQAVVDEAGIHRGALWTVQVFSKMHLGERQWHKCCSDIT